MSDDLAPVSGVGKKHPVAHVDAIEGQRVWVWVEAQGHWRRCASSGSTSSVMWTARSFMRRHVQEGQKAAPWQRTQQQDGGPRLAPRPERM